MRVAYGRRTVETIRLVAPHLDALAEATRSRFNHVPKTVGIT